MFIKLFLIALPVFFAIDIIWLAFVAKGFYNKHLGHLMRPDVNWFAAGIFYVIFLCGLVAFVISPALEKRSFLNAILFGALFGLVTYATYDLTNLATLKEWPLLVSIIDLIWGMVLSATVSGITYLIANRLNK